MEYDKITGWQQRKPKVDPIIKVEAQLSKISYSEFELNCPIIRSATVDAIIDSGARTTVAHASLLEDLGLTRKDLFPVKQKLCGANSSELRVIGGMFLDLSIHSGNHKHSSKVLCYVQEDNPGKFYLSRTACEQLGLLPHNFPTPSSDSAEIAVNKIKDPECSCPIRQKPPPMPTTLPYPAVEENREKIQEWLMDYYAASTFNTCEHQTLPLMSGPPLKLIVDKDAKPHAVHTPIPVPAHWQKSVKEGLDRDVKLGVIETVPWGTPTSWCARMVIVPKKDGRPRRTVDLQPLNAVSSRQTHHTESPFHQAISIPHNTKKTVCDAWNGYHSIPIREQDRHLTTFITPWGRYRYCTTPQGYMAAGDAYTRRFDEIIADLPNKKKCIDDTIMWARSIEESFFQTCSFLHRCGENGITLNPEKFQFAKDEVRYAGFEVTKNRVKPCKDYLAAIEKFPTPTDITGIRSWFGVVNQISYAFSMTEPLRPFRDLLKPGNKFYWDDCLNRTFEESKKVILENVKEGVQIFDPTRRTRILTDWSKTGTGFVMSQKYCECRSELAICCNTGWRTVLVGSKFNSKAEKSYAPIEGECLAVVRALNKCKYFILGCEDLIVVTDHKPLLKILGDRNLEDISNPRLIKLKEKTLLFRFGISYIAGSRNSAADAVSSYPVENEDDDSNNASSTDPDEYSRASATNSLSSVEDLKSMTWHRVQEASSADPEIQVLIESINVGNIPMEGSRSQGVSKYSRVFDELSVVDSVVLYKDRIVIPSSLRDHVLQSLHAAHQGVSSMIARADTSVYWPGINEDIRRTRERCSACNSITPPQPNAPTTPLAHLSTHFSNYVLTISNIREIITWRWWIDTLIGHLSSRQKMEQDASSSLKSSKVTAKSLEFLRNSPRTEGPNLLRTKLKTFSKIGEYIIGCHRWVFLTAIAEQS